MSNIVELSERLPTQDEIDNASEAAIAVANLCDETGAMHLREDVILAPPIASLIRDMLGLVASGNGISIIPMERMLSTQQAADYLNVSRPYLSKLLREKRIPHVNIGSHRRVKFEDLMKYRESISVHRLEALDEIAAIGQEVEGS